PVQRMPQNEDYENHNLRMKTGRGSVSFLLQGSSKFGLVHRGKRLCELRSIDCCVLSPGVCFPSDQHPRKAITTFQAPSIDCLHWRLRGFVWEPRFLNSHHTLDRIVVGTWPFSSLAGPGIHPPLSEQPPAQTIPLVF